MEDFLVDRRTFISVGTAAAASLLIDPALAETPDAESTGTVPLVREVKLSVNGEKHVVQVDTRMALLDALRDRLHLTGSKKGCDQGQCGAWTNHVDGERHLSCLTLTVAAQWHEITTI